MASSEEPIKLTYRELADRLGISVTAARSRVRRAKQQGRWRVIPRNHPSTPAQIELPAEDLDLVLEEKPLPKADRAVVGAPGDVSETVYVATLTTLNDVYKHISEVNTRLQNFVLENIDLREKLTASEVERQHLQHRVTELEHRTREQDERLMAGMLEKLEKAVAISRLSATLEERSTYVDRLELGVRNLQAKLHLAQRPLWKKVLGLRR